MGTNGLSGGSADGGNPSGAEAAAAWGSPIPDASSAQTDAEASPPDDTSASDAGDPFEAGSDTEGDSASGDAGGSGSEEAGNDAAETDAPACGRVDTTTNCGSCGAACDTTTGSPSCNGTTCSYACNAGYTDCDFSQAPDTDGCECATPACCGSSCQTTHADGVGQNYYDCNPLSMYGEPAAIEACTAFAGGNGSDCSDGWSCGGDSTQYVCYATNHGNNCTTCWGYSGTNQGQVFDCSCPGNPEGPWN